MKLLWTLSKYVLLRLSLEMSQLKHAEENFYEEGAIAPINRWYRAMQNKQRKAREILPVILQLLPC
jgi:hypothetical protein